MPTLELLSALSHDGGVQINLTDKICNVLDDHPEDSVLLPNVLNALQEMGLFSLTQTKT